MAQFDVYLNANPETSSEIPFLLDVQTDLLDNLATRVVAPFYLASAFGKPASHLNLIDSFSYSHSLGQH